MRGARRPRQALLAEAVAGGLLPAERVVLHERTARTLQMGGGETLAAKASRHWQAAGRHAEEPHGHAHRQAGAAGSEPFLLRHRCSPSRFAEHPPRDRRGRRPRRHAESESARAALRRLPGAFRARATDVLTVRFHTDGGPAAFSGPMQREFPRALAEIAEDADNRVQVLTGTGDRFMTDIDQTSLGDLTKPAM